MAAENKPIQPRPTKPEEEQQFGLKEKDRPELTTLEEQKEFDDMLEKDFVKIDPKTRRPVSVDVFYRVIHNFPDFLSANPAEYRAKLVIEEFEFVMDASGAKKRQVRTSFNILARDFKANYQPTIVESIAALSRQPA